ncbi:MAG: hypothetical protein ABL956_02765 [Hyphomonadaceae bacterium]
MSSRNPFRIRSFQRASGDEQFVQLFASSALDVLEGTEGLWDSLQYLRSAPGGGKTSLLRLMTPGPLRKVAALALRDPKFKRTAERLTAIEALKDGRPAVLGVILSFSNDYRDLDDLGPRAPQVFRALFSARIVLATLRAIVEMAGKSFPEDIAGVRAVWVPSDGATIPADAKGEQLRDWASNIEDSAYDVLDQLGGEAHEPAKTMIGFDGLQWLAAARFSHGEVDVDVKPALLLDELQQLSARQREALNEALTALRKPLGIWVSERLQALQANDLLADGVREGRDYNREVRLEQRWRGAGAGRLERFLGEIADLRVEQADGFQGRSFFPMLSSERTLEKWVGPLEKFIESADASLKSSTKNAPRYQEWIDATRSNSGDAFERAVGWQMLSILVRRDLARDQMSFDFDALPTSGLIDRNSPSVRSAAELVVCKEARTPFYFGPEKLTQLSSANADQFLELAGDLFEDAISARLLRKSDQELTAERQQEILEEAAKRHWRDIPRGSVRGHATLRFLESMADMCVAETFRPTAPYAPGVTGIGIAMDDRDVLVGDRPGGGVYAELTEVLSSCVAQNILEPWLDQRAKGQRWLVLYFNRLLCLHHFLPLGYGGWRPQKLSTLMTWVGGGALGKDETLI